MEIGIDIEKNERFINKSQKFCKRVFAPEELEFAKKFANPSEQLCSFWCVKEAVVKTFSNLKIPFVQIVTLHDESGKPFIKLNDTILQELKKINASEIKISVSNTKDYSVAVCLIF